VNTVAAGRWIGAERFLAGLPRVTLFCGGFGSGKTEIAVNFALHLAGGGSRVSIADLDIVNLYFRSREKRAQLEARGVRVLLPGDRLEAADLPIIQPEVKGAIERSDGFVVLDLGGDPVGARVMASIAPSIRPAEMRAMFVVNSRRPFTLTAEATARTMAEIGGTGGFGIDSLVVNSHLGDETSAATILEGIGLAEAVEASTGVGIAFVAVERRMLREFDAEGCGYPVMVLDRQMLKPWERAERLGRDKFKL